MAHQVSEIEVALPDREQTARAAARAGKPVARVALFLEGGEERQIVVPVRVGRLLMEQDLALPRGSDEVFEQIHALEGTVCFAQLTDFISQREYSTSEARDKLARYGYRPQEIEPALARAREYRFLDDGRFALNFIESRKLRGWGRRKIELELRQRGVDCSELQGYPEAFFPDAEELSRARAVLARKAIPASNASEKLMRQLVNKGFSYSVSRAAVQERLADAQTEPKAM